MDSRFHLKVEFHIYGETFKWDCSLNWSDGYSDIDQRITDWFKECHDTAKAKWDLENLKIEQKRNKQLEIEREKELLKSLKQKYPND